VQDNLDPGNRRDTRSRSNSKFNPMEVVYRKYFVDKNMRNILIDFEEYAACARNGGTISKMRNPGQDRDEDIRGTIVQEVSNINAILILFVHSILKQSQQITTRHAGPFQSTALSSASSKYGN